MSRRTLNQNTLLQSFEDGTSKDITSNAILSIIESGVTYGGSTLDANSALFNGSAFFEIDAVAARTSSGFSFSVLVNVDNTTTDQAIFSLSDSTNADSRIALRASGGVFLFECIVNGVTQWQAQSSAAANGNNYHLCGYVDSTGNRFYLDSVEQTTYNTGANTNTEDASASTFDSFSVGKDVNSGGDRLLFSGSLKDVLIDTKAITQNTADQLFAGIYGFDMIYLGGQSNQKGRGTLEAGVDDDYSSHNGRVYQWEYALQTLSTADNPLNHTAPGVGFMGKWRLFANQYVAKDLAYKRAILYVPIAKGGSGFDASLTTDFRWNVGEQWNTDIKASVTAAQQQHAFMNHVLFSWWNGEADAIAGNTTYGTDYAAFWTDFLATFPDIPTTIPFISLSPAATGEAGWAAVNTALQDFADLSSFRSHIDMQDQPFDGSNHFLTAGQRVADRREYNHWKEIVDGMTTVTLEYGQGQNTGGNVSGAGIASSSDPSGTTINLTMQDGSGTKLARLIGFGNRFAGPVGNRGAEAVFAIEHNITTDVSANGTAAAGDELPDGFNIEIGGYVYDKANVTRVISPAPLNADVPIKAFIVAGEYFGGSSAALDPAPNYNWTVGATVAVGDRFVSNLDPEVTFLCVAVGGGTLGTELGVQEFGTAINDDNANQFNAVKTEMDAEALVSWNATSLTNTTAAVNITLTEALENYEGFGSLTFTSLTQSTADGSGALQFGKCIRYGVSEPEGWLTDITTVALTNDTTIEITAAQYFNLTAGDEVNVQLEGIANDGQYVRLSVVGTINSGLV